MAANSRKLGVNPQATLTLETLLDRLSQFCGNNAVSDDASLTTVVTNAFSQANNPGLSAQASSFLTAFFINLFHVG